MTHDIAGKPHWDKTWEAERRKQIWDPHSQGRGNVVVRAMHAFIERYVSRQRRIRILEVGCGASASLPYFVREFDADVVGIDYSLIGCQRAREIASEANVKVDVIQADFFSPPADLLHSFDVVVSFGVVEHFVDTTATVRSLARFLRKGGCLLTFIPNMCGLIGDIQRLLDRDLYEKHVLVEPRMLQTAYEGSGLKVVECDYVLSSNFSVCHVPREGKGAIEYFFKKCASASLVRFTYAIWHLERWGLRIQKTREMSPYIICVGHFE